MSRPKHSRPLEERLCRYGEKFSGICSAVSIEQGRNAGIISRAKRCKLRPHHFAPRHLLFTCRQGRRSISGEILVVQLVSEFMQNNVLAVGRISCAKFHRVPGKHHRPHRASSLTESRHSSFFPNRTFEVSLFFHQICRWINKNREQLREIICFSMQQQKTSLCCDRHPNFVVDFKPGATFEPLFGEEHLNVIEKFSLVRSRQPDKECNSAFNDLQPFVRKRPRLKPLSLSFFQEPKDHGSI